MHCNFGQAIQAFSFRVLLTYYRLDRRGYVSIQDYPFPAKQKTLTQIERTLICYDYVSINHISKRVNLFGITEKHYAAQVSLLSRHPWLPLPKLLLKQFYVGST